MLSQLRFIGFTATVTIVAIASPMLASTPQSNATDPACYLRTEDGRQQNLAKICGRTQLDRPKPKLDPNAPVTIVVPSSDRPSSLWNTIPDLPEPPEMGEIDEQTLAQPQPGQNPSTPAVSPQD